jgi:hypothetical protein
LGDQQQGTSQYFCTYCKKHGHSLKRCNEAAKILAEHTPGYKSKSGGRQNNCRRQEKGKPPAKAGQTTVVELGSDGFDDESDYSGSDDYSHGRSANAGNSVVVN